MLLNDHVPTGEPRISLQVFASDIDSHSLAIARAGRYPEAIVNDVPTMRLKKYFKHEPGFFRIARTLREQILFSQHNVLRDPPFSRVDLVSCRNMLIYLERDAQAELLDALHFALNPGGLLFLGSAESPDFKSDSFTLVDKKHRIYRAGATTRPRKARSILVATPPSLGGPAPSMTPAQYPQMSELHQRLVMDHGSPSVIVDKNFRILHSGAMAARYLHHVTGTPSTDLLKAVNPALAPVLHPALLQAMQTGQHVTTQPVAIESPAGPVVVQMTVRPNAESGGDPVSLVVFSEVHTNFARRDGETRAEDGAFKQEIARLQQELDGTIDTTTASNEALRAANEELQSINEELRSASEELESSKEELQSLNEELTTVNYELKNRVEETAKVNDDLNNLIASMDIATLFVDRAMNLKGFTPIASSLFNVRQEDVGRSLLDITHHLRHDALVEDIGAAISSLRPVEREIVDDRNRWYLLKVSPYRTSEDRIDGAVINLIDISEQRRDQQRLRATSERLRLVAENTPDYAIITMDADGHVTSWNRGAALTFGYSDDEIIGRHFRHLFTEEDRANLMPEQELERAREQGHASDERWHLRKDGTSVYCSGATTCFLYDDTIGYAKIARDLTDRQLLDKRREELLHAEQKVRQQLEAASELRSEFLAVLSHELKHPLNLILLNAELVSRSPRVGTAPEVTRAIDTIRNTVHAQSRIIDDLLDLSRLTTGKLALNRTAVDWKPVVERIAQAVHEQATRKRLALEVDADEVMVYADVVRLEQIVWNLLTNAIKFTPEGGRVTLRLRKREDWGVLTVTDTGRGIDPRFLSAVFGMFEQVGQKVSTRRDSGLGIGLALVKNLAELQGGRASARSEGLGTGATFTVWLPVFLGAQPDAPAHRSIPSAFHGTRVLVVDDDVATVELLGALLSSEGALVTTATRADQALDIAAQAEFDLVLSDIALPDMDGVQFVRTLRANPRTASWPAIALSGFGRAEDVERSKAAGFNAHLTKPLSLAALADTWLRLLNSRSQG
jgi:two-component system CheB/CheR fusion protein